VGASPSGSGSAGSLASGSGNDSGATGGGPSKAGGSSTVPSCRAAGAALTNCGTGGEDCCASLSVPGGTYYRTYDTVNSVDGGLVHPADGLAADGGPSAEADPATVSGFRLDKYLVTVGRFRQFVAAWNGGVGYVPPAGAGKHTHLNGGSGLYATTGGYELGWVAADDSNIAPTDANLACADPFSTWTSTAGSHENLPISCVTWAEAYAFCIWDGGFLPSEAEWEYAAAGGNEQREFPWGSTDPGTESQYAIYGYWTGKPTSVGACYYPSAGPCTGVMNIAPVGTATRGAGRWGQLDLAGEMEEWNLDWAELSPDYANPCTDCTVVGGPATDLLGRVVRGGDFESDDVFMVPSRAYNVIPTNRAYWVGFRCASTP
jgi:formylglycine-generating enzyme required for sulfatase activity